MERLAASDLRAIIEVARELGEAQDVERFRARVLALLQRVVACDSASFNELSPSTGEAIVAAVDPADAVFAGGAELFAAFAHQNPLIAAFQRSADARVLKFSDFITRRQLHRLDIYDAVYGPVEVEYQIAVVLPAPHDRVIGIALNRRRTDFSERDRSVLRSLRPLVVQAYQHAAERTIVRASVAGLERAAEAAVIVVDASGRIEAATGSARRWLHELSAFERRDRLPESLALWAAAAQRSRGTDDGLQPYEPLRLRTLHAALTARFVPSGLDGLDAIVLQPDPAVLDTFKLRALGLTPRESEVLGLVSDGHSNAEIAGELSVSERTVAKHLQHIYAKLDVVSRTAAVAGARDVAAERW